MTVDVGVELAAARDAVARGDDATAFARLLAAWRACRDPVLAQAIDRVGARALRLAPALDGVEFGDRDAAWHAAAAGADPVMRGRLLATLTDVPRGSHAEIPRLRALVDADDPRVATAILAIAHDPKRYLTIDVRDLWNPLYDLACRCGDPRARAVIERAFDRRQHYANDHAALLVRLDKVRARLARAYPYPDPTLAPDARAIVDDLVARLAQPPVDDGARERALLAAIHADPTSDGPRAIYLDLLLERGDPRAELLALQLAPRPAEPDAARARDARCDELVRRHQAAWLGELAPHVDHARFERGFPASIHLRDRATPAPGSAWATVTTISRGLPVDDAHPMPALVEAWSLATADLERLADLATPPTLRKLGWVGRGDELPRAAAAFARVAPRLALEVLDLVCPAWRRDTPAERVAWPWRLAPVRELRITGDVEALPSWLAAIAGPSPLVELWLQDRQTSVIVRRAGPDAAWSEVAASNHLQPTREGDELARWLGTLAAALEQLAPGTLTRLSVYTRTAAWTRELRARYRAIVERHPAVDRRSITPFASTRA